MKAIKNIIVGLIISFVGSLPLGYLNIVGVEIFSKFGMYSLVFYLLGVITIEAVVIYLTVIFSNQLVNNKKLMKSIDFFAVFFLLLLAYLFHSYSAQETQSYNYLEQYIQYSPFLIGFVLCLLNFLQIPFWMGWNLYLINANHIVLVGKLKFYYIIGTLIGTFWGMMVAIVALDSLSHTTFSFSKYIMPIGIPLFFIVLAFFQVYKIYKKYIK
jgi:threonine/homoserine/homoserine lactone efflux protein